MGSTLWQLGPGTRMRAGNQWGLDRVLPKAGAERARWRSPDQAVGTWVVENSGLNLAPPFRSPGSDTPGHHDNNSGNIKSCSSAICTSGMAALQLSPASQRLFFVEIHMKSCKGFASSQQSRVAELSTMDE